MKVCQNCKKSYGDEEEYCEDCGTKLIDDGKLAPQASQQSPAVQNVFSGPAVQGRKLSRQKCRSCGWEGETDDEYCPECGAKLEGNQPVIIATMPIIEKLVMPDLTEIRIDAFPFQFGRAMMSNYPDSDTISSKHFIIYMRESNGSRTYEIEDSNSLNGTSLNGKVIGVDRKSNGKFPLVDGDKISLSIDPSTGNGKFEMKFKVTRITTEL